MLGACLGASETYGTEIPPETISNLTDAIVEDLQAWQHRPLHRLYPVLLIDAIVVNTRGSQVVNRPVYAAVGRRDRQLGDV